VAAVDAALSAKEVKDEPEQDVPFAAEPEGDDSSDVPPYAEWTNDDLRDELGKRELSKSGSKADLIARLEESDAP